MGAAQRNADDSRWMMEYYTQKVSVILLELHGSDPGVTSSTGEMQENHRPWQESTTTTVLQNILKSSHRDQLSIY